LAFTGGNLLLVPIAVVQSADIDLKERLKRKAIVVTDVTGEHDIDLHRLEEVWRRNITDDRR
jgi:hypothetical protein